MSKFDEQYFELIRRIDTEGEWNTDHNVTTKWDDGTPAYAKGVFHHSFTFTPDEFPIPTAKKVNIEKPNGEKDWIWRLRSNKLEDLRKMGIGFWNKWELEDGTIGEAYGAQLAKPVTIGHPDGLIRLTFDNQVHYVISELNTNPKSRRIMTEIFNVDDLSLMSIPPCVHHTQWDTTGNKLNLFVKARSSDVGLGLVFNIVQYAILHRQIAQVTGFELGNFVFTTINAHIYDRHMGHLKALMQRDTYEAPKLWINPDVKEFDDFSVNDVKLIDYKNSGVLKLELASHG